MWELLTGEEPYASMHYGAIIGSRLAYINLLISLSKIIFCSVDRCMDNDEVMAITQLWVQLLCFVTFLYCTFALNFRASEL